MATFSSGSFATSTPLKQPCDGNFYNNSPWSNRASQSSTEENLEFALLRLRKKWFNKRKNCENLHPFALEHKPLHSRHSSAFSCSDVRRSKETPRTLRSHAITDQTHQHFKKAKTFGRHQLLFSNIKAAKAEQLNDSGYFSGTEKPDSPKTGYDRVQFLEQVEHVCVNHKDSKEKSLACFNSSHCDFGIQNFADLSMSDMKRLYYIFRFQRTGLKPSTTNTDLCEENSQVMDMKKEKEAILLSWKNKLELISADPNFKKIDFLSRLYDVHSFSTVSQILSYLSGNNLQNASSVSQLWRKLVLEDKRANQIRCTYLKKQEELKAEMGNKLNNLFKRPTNCKILSSVENVPKEQLLLIESDFKADVEKIENKSFNLISKPSNFRSLHNMEDDPKEQIQRKNLKEINFKAFIEVGKNKNSKPMKCPSCCYLSLQNKQVITKYKCLFCCHEFCCICLKPYSDWHFCVSTHFPASKPHADGKRYLRRL